MVFYLHAFNVYFFEHDYSTSAQHNSLDKFSASSGVYNSRFKIQDSRVTEARDKIKKTYEVYQENITEYHRLVYDV